MQRVSRQPWHLVQAVALLFVSLLLLSLLGCQARAGKPAAEAEPEPPTTAKTAHLEITPDAQKLLDQMREAYQELKTLELAGKITGQFDVAGKQQSLEQQLDSSFQAPNFFRHEVKDEVLVGSTGDSLYMYNPKANAFYQSEIPAGEALDGKSLGAIYELLQARDPSLLFAVVDDPLKYLLRNAQAVEKLDDVEIEGVAHPAVGIEMPAGDGLTAILDPETHLLRQIRIDLKQGLQAQQTPDVKQAELTIDYTRVAPGASFPVDYFSWQPPVGAQSITELASQGAAERLVGKPAPEFTLTTLDGETVSLADLKGKAVVLDLWATWCPPCVESLPKLAELAEQYDDDQVAVYGLNVGETPEAVKAFVEVNEIELPVLLDPDDSVSEKYHVASIPQTVVIGPDGIVQRVFVGIGPNMMDELRAELDELIEQ